jgi:hypothetical protein
MSRRTVKLVLLALIALDIIFPLVIFLAPELWTRLFHDMPPDDPLGLLHRLGAGWAAFAFWMIVALRNWERDPGWLMMVAGIRWTESWADWFYVFYAHHATLFGWISLLGASPVNLLAGWFFWRAYRFYRCKAPDALPPPSHATRSGRGETGDASRRSAAVGGGSGSTVPLPYGAGLTRPVRSARPIHLRSSGQADP